MIEQYGKNKQDEKKKTIKRKNVKYVVPMPGGTSWLLKSNMHKEEMDVATQPRCDINSESLSEFSHLVMKRKFVID